MQEQSAAQGDLEAQPVPSAYAMGPDVIALLAGDLETEENAAVNGADYYRIFDAAYAAVQGGDMLKLLKNIDGNKLITIAEG